MGSLRVRQNLLTKTKAQTNKQKSQTYNIHSRFKICIIDNYKKNLCFRSNSGQWSWISVLSRLCYFFSCFSWGSQCKNTEVDCHYFLQRIILCQTDQQGHARRNINNLRYARASLVAQMAKNLHAKWETWIQSLGSEDPLEEGMATHSSILAWRIPMDRRTWWARVHGVAYSQTGLSN